MATQAVTVGMGENQDEDLLSGRNGVIVALATPVVVVLGAVPALMTAFFVLSIAPFVLPFLVWGFAMKRESPAHRHPPTPRAASHASR